MTGRYARLAKNLVRGGRCSTATMLIRHEEQQLGTVAGVRDWLGQSAPAPPIRKGWGYKRIAGALANLDHHVSDQTIANILKRHGIAPTPKRSQSTSWKDFIAAHMAVLAGTDFFTVEVLTWRGLVTYYVLFFSTWRLGALPSPASQDTPPKLG